MENVCMYEAALAYCEPYESRRNIFGTFFFRRWVVFSTGPVRLQLLSASEPAPPPPPLEGEAEAREIAPLPLPAPFEGEAEARVTPPPPLSLPAPLEKTPGLADMT